MANGKLIITQRTGENQFNDPGYNSNQISLINSDISQTTLKPNSFFEFHVFTRQGTIPFYSDYSWQNYNITSNDLTPSNIEIDVRKDIESIESLLTFQNITVVYNFFNNLCGTSEARQLIISDISSDRTELILKGTFTNNTDYTFNTLDYINYRANDNQYKDFYLNLSNNRLILGTNIQIDASDANNPLIFIKLYEPLPDDILNLQALWIVEKISDSLIFDAESYTEPQLDITTEFLSGPNINIKLNDEVNSATPFFNKTQLQLTTSSFFSNQISTLISSSGININVDYTDFNNFINYSSPTIRLQNFYLKMSLLEEYNNELADLAGVPGNSGSVSIYQSRIDEILQNFDGYDKFLYFESGSKSWPKTNSTYPYTLATTGSSEVLNWFGTLDTTSPYYGGEILSASNFDNDNKNYLLYSIPPYLRDDPQNAPYETFVSMIGQHFDNIWIYTKDITNKFNADNRINFGISRDLVSDAIKEFGIKLYQNNFSNTDLFSAFFGIPEDNNPTGLPGVFYESLYYGLGSWGGSIYGPLPSGSEGVRTVISASNDIIPVDDINKRIYKRIYHNTPFLVKSKGTKRGLQALINCFGVPDSILQINEFGGKDKVRKNDWDFYRRIYNKALVKEGNDTATITTNYAYTAPSLQGLNPKWGVDPNVPRSVEFRFKSRTNPNTLPDCTGLTNTPIREELFRTYVTLPVSSSLYITLEYFGSGSTTSSYSGSTFDTNNEYADLTLYVSGSSQYYSSSINLPFYNKDWWNVMMQYDSGSNKFNLYTGNKIFNGSDGTRLGFTGSTSITVPAYDDTLGYRESYVASLVPDASANRHFGTGKSGSINFSGSVQEYRFWTNLLTEDSFHNHVMNPLSIETGYLTGSLSPVETLAFRTIDGEDWSLSGSTASPTSRTSIHPKVTGSHIITSSFSSSAGEFSGYSNYGEFEGNKEFQFLNQPIAGIKNRINDKIRVENLEFPEGNTLSNDRPLQQNNEASQSYTNHLNYIEVGFSPTNQVNDDIIAQLGQLNIGDFIGDPRHRSSSLDHYQDLNNLRDKYFEKYIKNYDVNDFVRLIKYFDNSLFKMIKDFVPLRSSTSTGIIIKQHLLERNKYPQPKANPFTTIAKTPETGSTIKGSTPTGFNSEFIFKDITIDGIFKSQPRGFTTGSSLIVVSGSTGGIFNELNGINNRFGITQSYSESYMTPSGSYFFLKDNQDEFYNGEFSGSSITVTTGSLNLGANAFEFNLAPQAINYGLDKYIFESDVTSLNTFLNPNNIPPDGSIFFYVRNLRIERIRVSNISQSINITNNVQGKTRFNFENFSENVVQTAQGPTYFDYQVPIASTNANILDLTTSNTASFFASGSDTLPSDNSFTIDLSATPAGTFGYRGSDPSFLNSIANTSIFFSNSWGSTDDPNSLLTSNPNDGYQSPFLSNKNIFITSSFHTSSINIENTGTTDADLFFIHYLFERSPQGQDTVLQVKGPISLIVSGSSTISGSLSNFTSNYEDFQTSTLELPNAINDNNLYQGKQIVSEVLGFVNAPYNTGNLIVTASFHDYNLSVSGSSDLIDNNPNIKVINTEPVTGIANLNELERKADSLPLFNNVSDNRNNSIYFDLDYTQGGITPTNFTSVLNNNSQPAQTPDSNYTQKTRILPRYNGVKLTSLLLNQFSPPETIYTEKNITKVWTGDKSYGQLPVIELTKPNFVYFDLLLGTSPELEDSTQVKINYLIDKNGNPTKPLNGTPGFYNVEATYETGNIINISLQNSLQQDDPSLTNAAVGINLDTFNTSAPVIRGARRVDPVITNQRGSINDFANRADAFDRYLIFDSALGETTNFYTLVNNPSSSVLAGSGNVFRTFGNFEDMLFQTVISDENGGYEINDNGTYTFTERPVTGNSMKYRFGAAGLGGGSTFSINIRFVNTSGNSFAPIPLQGMQNVATIRVVRNNSSLGIVDEVLGERSFDFPAGSTDFNTAVDFETPFIEMNDEDEVKVQVKTRDVANGYILIDFTGITGFMIQPLDFPVMIVDNTLTNFWTTGSNFDSYLTSSTTMSAFYNNVSYTPPSESTFKPTNELFTIKLGDQFRFEGSEKIVHTVLEEGTVSTNTNTSGSIIVKVSPPIPPGINLNQFLIRRFNEDGTSVIIDMKPPSSSFSTTKGFMKNTFISQELEENIETYISRLVDKGIIPS